MRTRLFLALIGVAFAVAAQQAPVREDPGDTGLNAGRLSNTGPNQGKAKGKARPPSGPAPRLANGRISLGPLPGQKGVWEGNAGATLATNPPGGLDNPSMYLPTNLKIEDVPFQPWARALYNYRQAETTKDDPHVRCKASGGPRMFHTPYGTEFVESAEERVIYILGVGGPHTFRTIYMDGRAHPRNLELSFAGHSTGKWEGDTLVIDTIGFNEKFWLTREGIPHTKELHLTERLTRSDHDTIRYEATVDDPGAYTAPWTGGWFLQWQANEEMYEYLCQENNRDVEHMFGGPRN